MPESHLLVWSAGNDAARSGHEREQRQRIFDTTDRQFDQLGYDLYDLTEEEIAIVEGEVG